MRMLAAAFAISLAALPVKADSDANRLLDAMGVPGLLRAFAEDGRQAAQDLDAGFLGGQGGDVFAETVRRLHDPARLEPGLRASFASAIDPQVARQALVYFESDQGQRIAEVEVQAREAMVDDDVEAQVKAATSEADDRVLRLLSARNLVDRNTDISVAAQIAFFEGLVAAGGLSDQAPDVDGRRGIISEDTRAWLTGYYMLVASVIEPNDLDTYIAFWETDVGRAVDEALYVAFEEAYVALSFGLGQAVGRLLPQNEL